MVYRYKENASLGDDTKVILPSGEVQIALNLKQEDVPATVMSNTQLDGWNCVSNSTRYKLIDGSVERLDNIPIGSRIAGRYMYRERTVEESSGCCTVI